MSRRQTSIAIFSIKVVQELKIDWSNIQEMTLTKKLNDVRKIKEKVLDGDLDRRIQADSSKEIWFQKTIE